MHEIKTGSSFILKSRDILGKVLYDERLGGLWSKPMELGDKPEQEVEEAPKIKHSKLVLRGRDLHLHSES
jgi:hypothetical protein